MDHDLTDNTLHMVLLPASLLNLLDPAFIYSAKKSRPVAVSLCWATGIAIVLAALNRAFPINFEFRLQNQPHLDYLDYNSRNLHCTLSLSRFLISTGMLLGAVPSFTPPSLLSPVAVPLDWHHLLKLASLL